MPVYDRFREIAVSIGYGWSPYSDWKILTCEDNEGGGVRSVWGGLDVFVVIGVNCNKSSLLPFLQPVC